MTKGNGDKPKAGGRKPRAAATAKPSKPAATADTRAECYAEYSELMGQRQRLNSKIAAAFSRFEGRGINDIEKRAIKHAYTMSSKDKGEVERQHKANTQTMIAVGILTVADVGWTETVTQAEMELSPAAEKSALVLRARANTDGYNSALAGGDVGHCPYNPGSEAFVAWRDGWTDGHADRIAKDPGAANEKTADTRRARRAGDAMPPPGRGAIDPIGEARGTA
jgi:ribosome modulation factor